MNAYTLDGVELMDLDDEGLTGALMGAGEDIDDDVEMLDANEPSEIPDATLILCNLGQA